MVNHDSNPCLSGFTHCESWHCLLCSALQFCSRLIKSDHCVSYPSFSTHCPADRMWTYFVKCEGMCRHWDSVGWCFHHLMGVEVGTGWLACLVLKSLFTGDAEDALAWKWTALALGSTSHNQEASLCLRSYKTQPYRHGWSLETLGVLLLTGVLTFKTTVLEPQGTLWLIFPSSVYNGTKVRRDSQKVRHSPARVGNEERGLWLEGKEMKEIITVAHIQGAHVPARI